MWILNAEMLTQLLSIDFSKFPYTRYTAQRLTPKFYASHLAANIKK